MAARLRQQLARHIPNPYIVNWSVDVEDWLWANTSTPEKQLEAFYRGVEKGGNLAVMHYLNPTTIQYLRSSLSISSRQDTRSCALISVWRMCLLPRCELIVTMEFVQILASTLLCILLVYSLLDAVHE